MLKLLGVISILTNFFVLPPLVLATSCNVLAPTGVGAKPGPGVGEISLSWTTVPNIDHYTVVYGLVSNQYSFGVTNIGKQNTNFFSVKSLNPGTKYFFRIGAVQGCNTYSLEVSSLAKAASPSKVLGAQTRVRTYTVQNRDTLSQIAERFFGNVAAFSKISRANNLSNPNIIMAGMVLRIP